MKAYLKNFAKNEDGAVTVDFVVLTAALVILGIVVAGQISRGVIASAEIQGQSLADRPLGTDF